VRCGYGMAGGYFTNVMLYSSRNYHQERPREPRRYPQIMPVSKEVVVDCGALMLCFHVVLYLSQW